MTDIRLEVWDKPGTAGFGVRIETLDSIVDSARLQPVNGVGEGNVSVPDTFTEIDKILKSDPVTPANSVRSLIRAYLDGDISGVDPPYREWLPESAIPPSESETGRFEISGLGIEAILRDPVVEPWDWDGNVDWQSSWPDWIYGGRDLISPVNVTFIPHIFEVAVIGTGGVISGNVDIDISLDGSAFESATVAAAGSAFDVETALEALSYGLTVEVQGSGTEDTPWQVRILGPQGFYVSAVDGSGLTNAVARITLRQFGKLMPIGWTPSRVGSGSTLHGPIDDFRASIGAGSDPPVPSGCSAWIVFDGGEYLFPGAQIRLKVIPGGIYQLPDAMILRAWGANALVRVVLRDLNENVLHDILGNETFEEILLLSNTDTPITGISDIVIPPGITEIIVRVGHIGPGDPPTISIACPSLIEGFEADTIGFIVRELYDDWTTNHAASPFPLSYWVHGDGGFYVALDFTDALDSAGNAWPRDEKITIKRGERFDKVLQKIVGLGYYWRLVPAPVDGYWLLQIYGAPMGTSYAAADTPTIRGGRDVTRRAIRRWLPKTGALVEGANQFFTHAASAAAQATLGISTDYAVQRDFEPEAVQVAAPAQVDDQLRRTRSLVVNIVDVQDPLFPIPGRSYIPADIVRVIDPPEIVDDPEVVWSILYTRDEKGLTWEVQFGNESFADSGSTGGTGSSGGGGAVGVATTEGVRYLLDQDELVRDRPPEGPGQPPEPGCCPSCPAMAVGDLATMGTGATFLDWGISDDPDQILSEINGNLFFLRAGLYTVQLNIEMRWTLTATGSANWRIYSFASGADGLDGTMTQTSFGVSGGFMFIQANTYHTAHLADDGEQYSGGWELLVQQSAGMINAATGVLFDAAVVITRHTDGCAREITST